MTEPVRRRSRRPRGRPPLRPAAPAARTDDDGNQLIAGILAGRPVHRADHGVQRLRRPRHLVAGPQPPQPPDPDRPEKGMYFQDDLAILSQRLRLPRRRPRRRHLRQPQGTQGASLGGIGATGVIGQPTDRDTFKFTTTAGTLKFNVNTPLGGDARRQHHAQRRVRERAEQPAVRHAGRRGRRGAQRDASAGPSPKGPTTSPSTPKGTTATSGSTRSPANLPTGGISNEVDTCSSSAAPTSDDPSPSRSSTATTSPRHQRRNRRPLDPGSIKQFDILVGDGNDVVTHRPGRRPRCYILGGGGDDTITGGEAPTPSPARPAKTSSTASTATTAWPAAAGTTSSSA